MKHCDPSFSGSVQDIHFAYRSKSKGHIMFSLMDALIQSTLSPSWWYWGTLIVDDKVEKILCVSSISVTSCHQLSGNLLPNTIQRYTISLLHLHQCLELQRSFNSDMANKTDNALEWQRDQTSFSLNKSWQFFMTRAIKTTGDTTKLSSILYKWAAISQQQPIEECSSATR